MPEAKTTILVSLVILLALIVVVQFVDKGTMLADRHAKELNETYEEAWYIGYEWGAYDLFVETMEYGSMMLNDTLRIYSAEGCVQAIYNEGCEVVCQE